MIKKHGKAPLIITLSIVILIAFISGTLLIIRSNSPERRLREQLDLGYRYLEELEYDQAIVSFEVAIAIDSKCVDAYLGLADAYAQIGDFEKAKVALQNGYEATGDEAFVKRMQSIEQKITLTEVENTGNENDKTAEEDVQDFDAPYLVIVEDSDGFIRKYNYLDDGYEFSGIIPPDTECYARFNEKGDSIIETYTGESTKSIWSWDYQYDDYGRILFVCGSYKFYVNDELSDQNEWTDYRSYENDENGNLITTYSDGSIEVDYVDSNGNVIVSESVSADGEIRRIEYSYDSRGNLVRSVDGNGEIIHSYTNTYSDGVVLSYDNP